jgi:hypothetical protein
LLVSHRSEETNTISGSVSGAAGLVHLPFGTKLCKDANLAPELNQTLCMAGIGRLMGCKVRIIQHNHAAHQAGSRTDILTIGIRNDGTATLS